MRPASRWLPAIGLLCVVSGCAVDVSRTEAAKPYTEIPGQFALRKKAPVAIHLRRDMLGVSANGVIGINNETPLSKATVVRGEIVAESDEFFTVRDGDRLLHVRRDAIIAIEQLVE